MLLDQGGWSQCMRDRWDIECALFPARICAFLASTQPKLWTEMRSLHDAGLEKLVASALVKELDLKGTLHVLRHRLSRVLFLARGPTAGQLPRQSSDTSCSSRKEKGRPGVPERGVPDPGAGNL
jgi:hypothetical protein